MHEDTGDGRQLPDTPLGGKQALSFRDVTFSYTGNDAEPVLRNISFALRPGEMLGVIGSTGAGKSTLAQLLPRFYDVQSGQVAVQGTDVRHIPFAHLRGRIAAVPQKTLLFTGTIAENIRWGDEHAGDDEVERAARLAQAHDFISGFPEGYQTRLGQGGVNLSGGQKQRLAIARAIIRKPDILILDDCTSALDSVTEGLVLDGLRVENGTQAVLLIAQRITSVLRADRILVLENGEIVGYGRHVDLLRDCGVYRDIVRSQLGEGARHGKQA